jgi:hypothetical protein
MDDAMKPRPYKLEQSQEVWRLLRELSGYIKICRKKHHGTDFEGRQFALDALNEITGGGYDVTVRKST